MIVIPTCGRWEDQPTVSQLVVAGLDVNVVVQAKEYDLYAAHLRNVKIHVLPPEITTIAPTRQFIVDHVGDSETLIMVDDDLTFFHRRDDEPSKLRDITPSELKGAFDALEQVLRASFAHAGFAAREGANRDTAPLLENTRIMRVLGYNRGILRKEGIRFDRLEVMEDFDVALQLLEKGYMNAVLNMYAHNQAGSGKSGGCSHFRTPEVQTNNANHLHRLHSQYVKVRTVTSKGSFGGGQRTDVMVYWKKAYKDAHGN